LADAEPEACPLNLTGEERAALQALARRGKNSQAPALQARTVLACADGASVTDVAADLDVTRDTVRKGRSRFLVYGLEGPAGTPRPGAPRTITDEQAELVIARTLHSGDPGRTRTGRPGRWRLAVVAADATFSHLVSDRVGQCLDIEHCQSGQLYLREFPALRAVLDGLLVVDGYAAWTRIVCPALPGVGARAGPGSPSL
jgi:transposase